MADRRLTTFRASAEDMAEVDRLANEYGLNRTQFLLDSALGRLPELAAERERRLTDLEERVAVLERRLGLAME